MNYKDMTEDTKRIEELLDFDWEAAYDSMVRLVVHGERYGTKVTTEGGRQLGRALHHLEKLAERYKSLLGEGWVSAGLTLDQENSYDCATDDLPIGEFIRMNDGRRFHSLSFGESFLKPGDRIVCLRKSSLPSPPQREKEV